MRYQRFVSTLENAPVNTWFDMGLFLDKIRDNRSAPKNFPPTHKQFLRSLKKGIAFITFDYGIDGVSIEIAKYSKAFEKILGNNIKIHWVGSVFGKGYESLLKPTWKTFTLEGSDGFDDWHGYEEYFHTKLARGGEEYNALALTVWEQTVQLAKRLGEFVEQNHIKLLLPVNAASNPGNVSLAYALVLVSELMDVPVLNFNHDFYWESGTRPWLRKEGQHKGIRDHFFTNADIGEVFSLIEMLYPWDSPRWFQCNINTLQSGRLMGGLGFNPMAVAEIGTSISLKKYRHADDDERRDILRRIDMLFTNQYNVLQTAGARKYAQITPDWCGQSHPILLGSRAGIQHSFARNNLLLLQPTRILKRKRIEKNLDLIEGLLKHGSFAEFFSANSSMHLTLLITGPVLVPHIDYFRTIIQRYIDLLDKIPAEFRDRVFLAFATGTESSKVLEEQKKAKRLHIHEFYGVSNLVMLPSQTEGRGLPIVESCSSGVPIITSRYHPEQVFSEVIGEHLDSSMRLNVFEFPEDAPSTKLLNQLTEVLVAPESFSETAEQNREVVRKRYSKTAIIRTLEDFAYSIWYQNSPSDNPIEYVREAFQAHKKATSFDSRFKQLVYAKRRKYTPGYCKIEYMTYLKSLIDPSFFRIEEKELRGRVMAYCQKLVKLYEKNADLSVDLEYRFYKAVALLFDYYTRKDPLALDHSLSYRHRHRRHYPYRKRTEQELYGVIGALFRGIVKDPFEPILKKKYTYSLHAGTTNQLRQYLDNQDPVINDSERLITGLRSNKPIALFPGEKFGPEISLFVKRTLKRRLGVGPYDELTKEQTKSEKAQSIAPVTLFVRKDPINNPVTYNSVMAWLKKDAAQDVKLLYQCGLFRVVETNCLAAGVHLAQLGKEAAKELMAIKEAGGFVVAPGDQNMITLDLLDLPSYRLGVVKENMATHFMDLNEGDAYVQWVPAGLRPSLAYPTPVQSPLQFSRALKSSLFQECVDTLGEEKTLLTLKEEADRYGTPIEATLKRMLKEIKEEETVRKPVDFHPINGLHEDGSPWSGAIAKLSLSPSTSNGHGNWKFITSFATRSGDTVLSLIKAYEQSTGESVSVGWNGGYILNPELVGKLGIAENYIGSPLGLVVVDGKIRSVPLFNKPALLFHHGGDISVERVNLTDGLRIGVEGGTKITLERAHRNPYRSKGLAFFDLMYEKEAIPTQERTIYRLAGNQIIDILPPHQKEVPVLPVGITLAVPKEMELEGWKTGARITYKLPYLNNVQHAIEAGPLLLKDGKLAIDMENEGWTKKYSIATQAARLDYTDMRGPKIGVGIAEDDSLIIVAINGRIRESVGATHIDLANILKDEGATDAMGFDPGGSVTLIVDHQQLNISPYNKDYETNHYTLPPEPRRVGNAILGIFS